jgi:AraC-like DNA-binding protein
MADPRQHTRELVKELLERGLTVTEIARQLGVSKPTVCHHARRLGHPPHPKYSRRYDWDEVQRYYDEGHTIRECREHFGFANETWNQARRRGDVQARPQAVPVDLLFVDGRPRNRGVVKRRLIALGLRPNRCGECGIADWRGKPLSLELHHLNGDGADNRVSNLALLCPNCHSQTDNYAGRGRTARPVAA